MDTRSVVEETAPPPANPPRRIALRVAWVVIRLVLVYWLAETGELFFYQGF